MSVDLKDFVPPGEEACCSAKEQDGPALRSVWLTPPPLQGNEENVTFVVQREKAWHRFAAYLKAGGKTNAEIAEIAGVSPTTVNYITKQTWFDKMVVELIENHGGDKVAKFFDESALPAAQTLAGIMNDPDAANRDRLAAANSILDRKYGKPNQPVSMLHKSVEARTLTDDELARIATSGGARTVTATECAGAVSGVV